MPLVTVEDIVRNHWHEYGRNYYRRYDYENLEEHIADKVFARIMSQFKVFESEEVGNTAVNFTYTDPFDGKVSKNQGCIFRYEDGSRFIFRRSVTGSQGVIIRIFIERYSFFTKIDVKSSLEKILDRALKLCQIEEITGRQEPTVIT